MKGLILAFTCLGVSFLLSFIGLRFYRGTKYFKVFMIVFLVSIGLYGFLYRITLPNLGFIPPSWREPFARVDCLNGALWMVLIYHLFWDGMYMFFFTGFSTGILQHLILHQKEGLHEIEIIDKYGGFTKSSFVVSDRVSNLEKGHYLKKTSTGYILTRKGVIFAELTLFFKKLLNIKELG